MQDQKTMSFNISFNETQTGYLNNLPMKEATNTDFIIQFCGALDDSFGKAFTFIFIGFFLMMLGKRIGRLIRYGLEKSGIHGDDTCPNFIKNFVIDLCET